MKRSTEFIACPVCERMDIPADALTCPMCRAELPQPARCSATWVLATRVCYFALVLLILAGPARGAFAPFLTLIVPAVLAIGGVLIAYSVRGYLDRRREMRSLSIQREIYIRIRQ